MIKEMQLDIGENIWGHAILLELENSNINSDRNARQILDSFCNQNKLKKIEKNWNEISITEAKKIIFNGLRYDIAYNTFELNPLEVANEIYSRIMDEIVDDDVTHCFTNWKGDPWINSNGSSWTSLTKHAFDIGVAIFFNNKLLFIYFMSED